MGADYRIGLCGRLRLEVAGERREGRVRGRQGRLLLAFLVLHRDRPVRRDELVEALTTGDGTAPGPAVLPSLLSRLRGVIAPARLDGRDALVLALPEGAWVDVEAARSALAGARVAAGGGDWSRTLQLAREARTVLAAELLAGHEAPWLDAERRALGDLRVEALELAAGAGARVAGAGLAEAEQDARAAVAAAPYRESARVALLQVLRARGNVAEALRAFEDVRVLLRDELGASPGPELLAVHEELLRVDRARQAIPVVGAARRVAGLEERERELDELDGALGAVRGGDGRVVLLEGPAGVGKTRLLTELRARAGDAGVLALGARAGVLERAFPFGVVRQLLEPALAAGELGDDAFAGAAVPARAVLADPGPGGEGAGADTFAVLHGLFGLVRRLAERRPVALCVDDVQWCDLASLRFLAYLARRVEGTRVLLAATLRTGEPSADDVVLAELAEDPAALVLRPRPLGVEAVRRLAARALGAQVDPAFAAACHEATGGNPLLVGQLLGALAAERVVPGAGSAAAARAIGPRAVSRTVRTRLARLSPDATAVARAVAILGDAAQLGVVAELAGVSEAAAAAAAGALVRAEVLRDEHELGFVHPLVAEAVHGDVPSPERDLQHLRAARALAARAAGADRVAAHLLDLPPRGDGWVVERLRDAGRLALARGAPDSATTFLARALDEPPRPAERAEVLYELARAESGNRVPLAIAHLREALAAAADPPLRAQVAGELARTLLYVGEATEAQALALAVRAELPDELADLRDGLSALAISAVYAGATQVVDLPGLEGAPRGMGGAMLASVTAFTQAVAAGSQEAAVQDARGALAVDELLALDNPFWGGATIALVLADRHDEALDACERALVHGQRRGSLRTLTNARLWQGFTRLRAGELEAALELLERAAGELSEWGSGTPMVWRDHALAYLAVTRRERDDVGGAADALDAMARGPVTTGMRFGLCARGELLLAEGRVAEALAVAERLAGLPQPSDNPNWVPWRSLLARALAAAGRTQEALAIAGEDVAFAARWGAPSGIGRTLRVLGELEGADGLPRLREAVTALSASPARLDHAEALAALGAATAEPERTRILSEALALAGACGAERLARTVRAALDRRA